MDEISDFEPAGNGRTRFPITCVDNSAIDSISEKRARGEFVWVNLRDASPEEIKQTGRELELHPLTVEDMLEFDQRAKVEEYDNYAYIVSYGATMAEGDNDMLVEIHIVYASDYLVTVAKEESIELDNLHEQSKNRELSGQELLHSVLDVLVDSYAPVLDRFDAEIEQLEELIVQRDLRGRELEIHHVRRRLGRIDRVVHRQLESFTRIREMLRRMPGHHPDDFPYFRDLQDHLIHVGESADAMRDRIAGLFELYMAALDNRQNIIMKQFTVIAGIFLPLSVLTGFFGMNFGWMVREISDGTAFLALGIALPLAILGGILTFIASRGLFGE
ncbi:MAG: magnesium transporter CorA family protein [Thermoleophilaceae bacterium]|nr:magnesium transporter CorA family protein [Thermoleophilaceae bacterium]